MIDELFKFRKPNFKKLKAYGFKKNGKVYEYSTEILNGQFNLFVFVDEQGKISTRLIDIDLQEEYVLHLMPDSVGEFVGKIRSEFEAVLTDIKNTCFERDVFKSEQAKQIIEYIRKIYGNELEYLWEKFSNNAIWRRTDNNKWYALLVVLPKSKLGLDGDEVVDIIDIRIEPEKVEKIVDNKSFFKAYHMNKKHWLTIILNNSVPTQTIFDLIDNSYTLAKK